MTMPPPPPTQPGSFGVPPKSYAPAPPPQHEPRQRDLGTDPAVEGRPRKRWPAWLLGGVGAAAVIGVVVALILTSFSAPNLIDAEPSTAPLADAPPTANPTSSFGTANPVEPAPGSQIPIETDVSFPGGMTFVMPQPGGWSTSTNERQPDSVILEDLQSGAYIQFLQTTKPASSYRDEDLTHSFLNTAYQGFTGSPHNAGAPASWFVSGAGYSLELLVQRVEWDGDNTVALVISRIMPGANTALQVHVIAERSEIDNPSSRVWQKLNELTFTVP